MNINIQYKYECNYFNGNNLYIVMTKIGYPYESKQVLVNRHITYEELLEVEKGGVDLLASNFNDIVSMYAKSKNQGYMQDLIDRVESIGSIVNVDKDIWDLF